MLCSSSDDKFPAPGISLSITYFGTFILLINLLLMYTRLPR